MVRTCKYELQSVCVSGLFYPFHMKSVWYLQYIVIGIGITSGINNFCGCWMKYQYIFWYQSNIAGIRISIGNSMDLQENICEVMNLRLGVWNLLLVSVWIYDISIGMNLGYESVSVWIFSKVTVLVLLSGYRLKRRRNLDNFITIEDTSKLISDPSKTILEHTLYAATV